MQVQIVRVSVMAKPTRRVVYVGRAVLLSRVDELVLNQLSREWLTPLELFVSAMKARTGLYDGSPTWATST
ncbi:hypothetical protein [Sorangium sp. So ce1389]|uniref:hypothetical protein n=1 Tax=Sorangium sp. So ce1389 TaxID=3133336 RepID=UPI003F615B11